jgi:hypothetical protein
VSSAARGAGAGGLNADALPWRKWPALMTAFVLADNGSGLAEPAESALVTKPLPDHRPYGTTFS